VVQVLLDVLPGVVGAQAELLGKLPRDPPVGLLVVRSVDHGLAQGDERLAEEFHVDVVVPLEVHRLGQDHVGPARNLARDDVHHREQVERFDRADGFCLVGQRVDQVGRVGEPAPDGVRLPGERRVPNAGGDGLAGERVPRPGVVDLASLRLGVRRVRVAGDVHARRHVEAALAAPASQEGVEEGDRPASLRVVAVPGGVAARVHERRGLVARHLVRRFADHARLDSRLGIGPLGREGRELRLERVETEPVRLDVRLVVEFLVGDHVHPGQQQRQIGAWLDRQVVLRLARRHGEPRVDNDDGRAAADGVGELLCLGVVHVLAQVGADEHQALRVSDVGALRRPDFLSEGQGKAHVPRPATLGEGRRGDVRRSERPDRVLEEGAADAMREQRDRFGTVPRLDLLHLPGDHVQGLVPRDRGPFLLAPARVRAANERCLQAVRVEMGPDATGTPRAQPATAQRILRVPLDLPELPLLHVRDGAALPEADVAERGDLPDALCGVSLLGYGPAHPANGPTGGRQAHRRAGDLEEPTPRQGTHDDSLRQHQISDRRGRGPRGG
jgi:hypothetical protein